MDRRLVPPTFPNAPQAYEQRHMQDLIRSLNTLVTQLQNPGGGRNSALTITGLTNSETGLEPGALWNNGGLAGIAGTTPINPTVDALSFDTTAGVSASEGQLAWNASELTLDLGHNAIVQQIGQETFMRVVNNTGSSIAKGVAVGFAGVNGGLRIEVAPYLADGNTDTLLFVGVTAEPIDDTEEGFVTLYGRVRNIDTTGTAVSESWGVGDLLWANPSTAGALTKVKPTAPNNVVSVAAVLAADATDGQIMVRPTYSLQQYYGEFIKTASQTATADGAENLVTWSSKRIGNGVEIDAGVSSRLVVPTAGLYNVVAEMQFISTNSSKRDIVGYFKINGTDAANSARYLSIAINNGYQQMVLSEFFSLSANDYIELGFGVVSGATDISVAPVSATANWPAAPAALMSVFQIQQ